MLKFLNKNPQQLLEWIIFGRSPYTENSLGKYWKLSRRYIINLLTSSRLQFDAYYKKKKGNHYFSNNLVFNGALPIYTQQDIVQGIDDALDYQRNTFAILPNLSKNQQAFLNKLQLLKQEQHVTVPFVTSWINSYQPSRWKSLKELSKQLAQIMGKPTRKLFSAVRLIVVFTLFDHYMKSVPQLVKDLPVEQIVSLPFKRKRKGRLPIKLMMKKDYVITREGNASDLTRQVRKHGKTTLGFPQLGKKKLTAQILFPAKVLEYLNNGAKIKVFQVSSGSAPSFKPSINVVLEGPHSCFHSTSLLYHYHSQIPKGDKKVLGVDINRLGKFMLAFNTPIPLPKDLLLLAKRYQKLTNKVLRELQKGFINDCKTYDARGALAKAIYTMPDNLYIYKKTVWLASLEMEYDVKLQTVPPQYTSARHYGCGGTLNRNQNHYDYAPCTRCCQKINTHSNAALNIASIKGSSLPYNLFPSMHVRGQN